MARWRKHFSQLFNVHGADDVRQRVIYTAKPLVPEPSAFDIGMAIEKLKRYRSSGSHQIPAELIASWCRTVRSEIHKLINSIWNKEELPEVWKDSIIVPIYKKGDERDYST